jgi:alcohol dehydrogenase class IV
MSVAIAFPRVLHIGAGASSLLPEALAKFGLSRPFLISDHYLEASGRIQPLLDTLAAAGIQARIFVDTMPEPTAISMEAAAKALAEGEYDCVIGFGGGSPIDTAKGAAILAVHGGRMRDYKTPHVQDLAGLPIIAVPTTAGTGSEATRFTVATDDETSEKMLCAGLAYLPLIALVDYELTLTKPRRLTADTGIDSLTHAIEAYVSRRANPVSDLFALAAMREIAPNLRAAWKDGSNREARERLMLGATLAGIAFSNSSVALVHGMSRPIGSHFHVPHGLSNAMLLPAVTAFSAPAAIHRYAECARAIGVAVESEGEQAAVARLVGELTMLNTDLEVPSPRTHGIDEQKWQALLPVMIEQAVASGSPANNPRVPTEDEMREIYRQAWIA